MCRNDPEFDDEELPYFTNVSDEESIDQQKNKKNYRSLFTKDLRRVSTMITEMGEGSVGSFDNGSAIASSTVIEHLKPCKVTEDTIAEIEPAKRKGAKKESKQRGLSPPCSIQIQLSSKFLYQYQLKTAR